MLKVTTAQKLSVSCPKCHRKAGRPCVGSRIPSASSFGGGWGGPPDLDQPHPERRAAYLSSQPDRDVR